MASPLCCTQRTAGGVGAAAGARSCRQRTIARAKPSNAKEVLAWAGQQFLAEVAKPGSINLAKACMIIALEEEAVATLEQAGQAQASRTSATAATWSLARLDGLAAQVAAHLAVHHPHIATLPARAAASQYPMQLLASVNAVLFDHGYSACNRYGTVADSQLAAVLESGPGSCAALTVLYIEVCERLGMRLRFKVLEDGRYSLVWPVVAEQPEQAAGALEQQAHSTQPAGSEQQQQQQQPEQPKQQRQQALAVAGEACVVDVYGGGALLTVAEVCELFAVSEEQLLAGSSRRELLAALLAESVHAHWCAACRCPPSPALMTPLTAATAASHEVVALHGLHIERAAAAAEKRLALLPGDLAVQLQLALLYYFSGRYEDAFLELGSYIEAATRAAADAARADPVTAAAGAATGDAAADLAKAMASGAAGGVGGSTPRPAAAAAPAAATTSNMRDVLLLFDKLQLELVMHAPAVQG